MPSGPRFGVGDHSIHWKRACKKEEQMMEVFERRNIAMQSAPKRDALATFMAKFGSSTAGPRTEEKRAHAVYDYSPLDGYSRQTKQSAALRNGQVPLVSMRVLPLLPAGSRPYETLDENAVRQSKPYASGAFLATTSEVYGWQPPAAVGASSLPKKPTSWHGRRRWGDGPSGSSDGTVAAPSGGGPKKWFGRQKWTDHANDEPLSFC